MKYQVPGTLAFYRAAPHFKTIDMATYPVSAFGNQSKAFYAEGSNAKTNPDREALDFYCLNHLMALVTKRFTPYEQLPVWADKIAKEYLNVVGTQTLRMTFYMFMIITREARHNGHNQTGTWSTSFAAKYGANVRDWFHNLKGGSSHDTAAKFREQPPAGIRAGVYARACAELFFTGSFGGSFGGKPWGEIAQTVARFVTGETTAEMLIDTAYTLAHNNGPMFNKGMLYGHHSDQFLRILDVQRSGQIPEMLIEGTIVTSKTTTDMLALATEHMPEEFGSYVDWYKVEALGALHTYPQDKLLQVKKHGLPGNTIHKPHVAEPQTAAPEYFTIMPGLKVEVIHPLRKAA